MIARIWNWLFHACRHEWEVHKEHTMKYTCNGSLHSSSAVTVLRCKKCGDLKQFRVNS